MGVWGGAELGWGGEPLWVFSRRICVKAAGRPKWGCGGGSRVTTWAFARRICVKTAVRVKQVQGTKAGKGGPL